MPDYYRPNIDVDVANLSDWGVRFDRLPPDYDWLGPYQGELAYLWNYMDFVQGMERDFSPENPAWEPTPLFWGVWVCQAVDTPVPASFTQPYYPLHQWEWELLTDPNPIYTELAESTGLHA